ncbi:MAG TPA: DHH family phosphoesterase [Candidatus Coprenecus stercoravium]|uniref:DHH family phosphoesterase n=1 Tax=Candidatus Coprenecus stercoravium TaxID=2840735 RepID=A0A9D2KAA6_9BACT|nr:DHH family phosphoesterase [Candidatus Coprenecus stercoravium]
MTLRPLALEMEKLLEENVRTVIVCHFNPDGDAIGSSVGLKEFLKAGGHTSATIVIPSEMPAILDFLDPDGSIICYTSDKAGATGAIDSAEIIVCLDFNKIERTEWLSEHISSSKAVKVMVDHHPAPVTEGFSLVISDPGASSTCELLYRTLMNFSSVEGDCGKICLKSLTALAAGMLTDTNNFNNSITPDTFKAASEMLGAGVDFDQLNNLLFKRFSESRMRLMGHLLSDSMEIEPKLRAASMVISLDDRGRFGLQDGDSEGFVNLPLMIKDVEVSALFSETKDFIKVSLRSKGAVSVNSLAKAYFNGGGHERAAGGRLYGIPIGEVRGYYLNALEQFLHDNTRI